MNQRENASQTTVITIDGPAGTGKSAAARRLAERIGFEFLDTGAMYRCVAWQCLHEGLCLDDHAQVVRATQRLKIAFEDDRILINGFDVTEAIRSSDVTAAASRVAVIPEVRAILVRQQREWSRGRSVVSEGRDQGTVAFPHAKLKFFLTAEPEVRARRRYEQLQESGSPETYESILDQIHQRDCRDEQRSVAPLKPADDALIVDTSEMTLEDVVAQLERETQKAIAPRPT